MNISYTDKQIFEAQTGKQLGLKEFNWLSVLKDLAAGTSISIQDHARLTRLAGCWPTCACSQVCADLPRNWDKSPKDHHLKMLGLRFYHNIEDSKWTEALNKFHQIEQRVEQLLNENNE